ncbi:MAG: flagellar protein FlaG [Lachnospiraceae bacterium]|nr:flagellar protein FlaG [Lachnospiraceae bacterium]
MKIEAIAGVKSNTEGDFDAAKQVDTIARGSYSTISAPIVTKIQTGDTGMADQNPEENEEGQNPGAKDPTQKTIDAMMSEANQKLSKTRCEYSYDELTRRVCIKVYDKETDKLIREVPPEKSLEALQKIWELAGIIVDEKR